MNQEFNPSDANSTKGRNFSAFAYSDYRIFWFGITLAYLGYWTQVLAQGWLILRLTDSAFMVGLIAATAALPLFMFSLVGGAIGDSLNRRYIVAINWILTSLLMILMAYLLFAEMVKVWHVFVIVFFTASFQALGTPARQALIPELVPEANIMSAVSLWSGSFHVARTIGPVIAAILVRDFGEGAAFLFYAFGSAVFAVTVMKIKSRHTKQIQKGSWLNFKEILDGFKHVRHNNNAFGLLVLISLIAVFGTSYLKLLPVFTKYVFGGSVVDLGALMFITGAGSIVSITIISLSKNIKRTGFYTLTGFFFFGLGMIFFSLSSSLMTAYITLALIGFFWGIIETFINSILFTSVPKDYHGRVMSMMITTWGFGFIGNTISGGLAQLIGAPITVAMIGIYTLCATIFAWFRWPLLKDV